MSHEKAEHAQRSVHGSSAIPWRRYAKSVTPFLIGIIVLWSIPLIMYFVLTRLVGVSGSALGSFGDWFGAANSLLAGFSFAGVVVALFLQLKQQEQQSATEQEENRYRLTLLEQQTRLAKAQAYAQMKRLIMHSNSMILQSQESLEIALKILYPGEPIDIARKRWIAFNILNSAELAWFLTTLDFDHAEAVSIVPDHHLGRALQDEDVMDALLFGGYSPDFIRDCRREYPHFDKYALIKAPHAPRHPATE